MIDTTLAKRHSSLLSAEQLNAPRDGVSVVSAGSPKSGAVSISFHVGGADPNTPRTPEPNSARSEPTSARANSDGGFDSEPDSAHPMISREASSSPGPSPVKRDGS